MYVNLSKGSQYSHESTLCFILGKWLVQEVAKWIKYKVARISNISKAAEVDIARPNPEIDQL